MNHETKTLRDWWLNDGSWQCWDDAASEVSCQFKMDDDDYDSAVEQLAQFAIQ